MTSQFHADPAVLVLEDGTRHPGRAYGARGTTLGEVVFATGMTGYQETLTDPSYAGQIVLQTAPHIGNTGMNGEDPESRRIWVSGYIVRDPSRVVSNWRADESLDDALVADGVVGISGIDTRAVTRHIRSAGSMRGGIFSGDAASLSADEQLRLVREAPQMAGRNLSAEVSVAAAEVTPATSERIGNLAVLDLGVKQATIDNLAARGFDVHVLPQDVTIDGIRAIDPVAVFYSNGPGDPAASDDHVALLRGVLDDGLPFFGICFGNQLLGRALGLGTYKLPFGHRGINQPVLDKADRPRRDHRAQPRLRRRRADRGRVRQPERLRPRRGQPRRAQRRRRRGPPRPRHPGLLGAVPPRGRRRSARRQLPLRPFPRHGHRARSTSKDNELMPKRDDIKSVLVIGSGPIVIGQACEFDYSGTQACRVLREEGVRVILVNSNPATIMTDPDFADATYIEPITWQVIETIIAKEKPDAILPTLGGQTALNAAIDLHNHGILEKYDVELIGASFEAINKGEDRQIFKQLVLDAGADVAASRIAHTMDDVPRRRRRARLPARRAPVLHDGRPRLGLRLRRARPPPHRRRRPARLAHHRGAPRGVDPRVEGVRARAHARHGRQHRRRLLDRERRPGRRAHRRLDHGRPGADAHRPRVPEAPRHRHRHHPRRRRRHRRLQHPVRRRSRRTAASSSSR